MLKLSFPTRQIFIFRYLQYNWECHSWFGINYWHLWRILTCLVLKHVSNKTIYLKDNFLKPMNPGSQPRQLAQTSKIWSKDKVKTFMTIFSELQNLWNECAMLNLLVSWMSEQMNSELSRKKAEWTCKASFIYFVFHPSYVKLLFSPV